jgi:hypothetical protein
MNDLDLLYLNIFDDEISIKSWGDKGNTPKAKKLKPISTKKIPRVSKSFGI